MYRTFIFTASAIALAYITISLSFLFALFEEKFFKAENAGSGAFSDVASALMPRARFLSLFSAIFFCAAFYFIPMGSLPAFAPFRRGIFFFFALVFLAVILSRLDRLAAGENILIYLLCDRGVKFFAALAASLSLFLLFASLCGLPGALLSFETYASPLLFESAGACVKAGFVLLAFSFIVLAPDGAAGRAGFAGVGAMLEALLYPAVIAALFLPLNVGLSLGLSALPMFGADFLFFWLKVFIIKEGVMPSARRTAYAADGFLRRLSVNFKFLLFCCGALLFALGLEGLF